MWLGSILLYYFLPYLLIIILYSGEVCRETKKWKICGMKQNIWVRKKRQCCRFEVEFRLRGESDKDVL